MKNSFAGYGSRPPITEEMDALIVIVDETNRAIKEMEMAHEKLAPWVKSDLRIGDSLQELCAQGEILSARARRYLSFVQQPMFYKQYVEWKKDNSNKGRKLT